jgi:hypothetical protein
VGRAASKELNFSAVTACQADWFGRFLTRWQGMDVAQSAGLQFLFSTAVGAQTNELVQTIDVDWCVGGVDVSDGLHA